MVLTALGAPAFRSCSMRWELTCPAGCIATLGATKHNRPHGSFGSRFFHFLTSSAFFHSCPLRLCGGHLSQFPRPDLPSLSSLGTLDWSSCCSPLSTAALGVLLPLLNVSRQLPEQKLSSARPQGFPTSVHSPPVQPAPVFHMGLHPVLSGVRALCPPPSPCSSAWTAPLASTYFSSSSCPFHHHHVHSSESVMLFHTWPPLWWFTELPNLHSQATKNIACPMNI